MLSRGVRQEQKPTVLCSLSDFNTDCGSVDAVETIFKRKYDFSFIDYLFFSCSHHQATAVGTTTIYLYINDVQKIEHSCSSTTVINHYEIIDCTALSGLLDIKVTRDGNANDDHIIDGLYMHVIDG